MFERESKVSWSVLTLDLLDQMAKVAAPLIEIRRKSERGVGDLVRARVRGLLETLLRPSHLALKSGILLVLGVLVAAYLLPAVHHVTADGELVPLVRRVITAPIQISSLKPGKKRAKA